jgi:hypothetical protein
MDEFSEQYEIDNEFVRINTTDIQCTNNYNINAIFRIFINLNEIIMIYYKIYKLPIIYINTDIQSLYELNISSLCNFFKMMAGNRFIYKFAKGKYNIYGYDGKYWQYNTVLINKHIRTELYDLLLAIFHRIYYEYPEFVHLKNNLDQLKKTSLCKKIVETYKEIGVNNDIDFDDKWYLFGFNNKIYDLEKHEFRDHKYDDYVSITTGYNWREPTQLELDTLDKIIKQIMPIEVDRLLYLQILSTSLDGKCLEKFIIFNGSGRNGKGLINDILLTMLGNIGLIGNNAILFEKSKTGSNPEKANIHKKRAVIFREPSERNKFENSVVKELTGGGGFSARSHYEKDTNKELNATMIVECNKRPTFAEEPNVAESERIIDLHFKSTFTTDTMLLDIDSNIYLANNLYKTKEFQKQHKYALFKILSDVYYDYITIYNGILQIPLTIHDRTSLYLELSCNIVQWFKNTYEKTQDGVYCKLKDVFNDFTLSEYYANLTKNDKRKYNKSYFVNYFETNMYLKQYFVIYRHIQCIRGWRKIIDDDIDIFV